MPKREKPGEFGGYWLSRRANSPMWCRTWFDPDTRQTRRESLGVSDLEKAKERLARWVIANADRPVQESAAMTIAEAAMRYWERKAKWDKYGQPRSVKSAGTIRRNLEIAVEEVGDLTVAELNKARQEELKRALAARNFRPDTIRRVFEMLFAALNFCYQAEELDRVPPRIKLAQSPPKDFVATYDQIAAFWDAPKPPQFQMFLVLLLGTGARPSTVLELTKFQCDFADGFIDLNPPARLQTDKRRAVVPMCAVVRRWAEAADPGPLVSYLGRPIEYPNQTWRRIRRAIGLPEQFTPGAMRHTIATELARRDVPDTQISQFLGHLMPNRVTARYAKRRPRFMVETVEALDAFFEEIAQRTKSGLSPVRVSGVLVAGSDESKSLISGGRGRVRTCDPYGVNVVLYR